MCMVSSEHLRRIIASPPRCCLQGKVWLHGPCACCQPADGIRAPEHLPGDVDSYRSAGWGPLLLYQIVWDLLGSVHSLSCNQLFTWEVMLAETLMNF